MRFLFFILVMAFAIITTSKARKLRGFYLNELDDSRFPKPVNGIGNKLYKEDDEELDDSLGLREEMKRLRELDEQSDEDQSSQTLTEVFP